MVDLTPGYWVLQPGRAGSPIQQLTGGVEGSGAIAAPSGATAAAAGLAALSSALVVKMAGGGALAMLAAAAGVPLAIFGLIYLAERNKS